jgi:hypothetical protein
MMVAIHIHWYAAILSRASLDQNLGSHNSQYRARISFLEDFTSFLAFPSLS